MTRGDVAFIVGLAAMVAVAAGLTLLVLTVCDRLERRAAMRLARKFDRDAGFPKPYPGVFGEAAGSSYVDLLLSLHPSERTLAALQQAMRQEAAECNAPSENWGSR